MGGITNATNSQSAQNIQADQPTTESAEPKTLQSAVKPSKSQDDPVASARAQQGMSQNVAEYKTQSNFRSQYMREELSKRMEEGAGKPVLFGDNRFTAGRTDQRKGHTGRGI
jgi:hypothetical protein